MDRNDVPECHCDHARDVDHPRGARGCAFESAATKEIVAPGRERDVTVEKLRDLCAALRRDRLALRSGGLYANSEHEAAEVWLAALRMRGVTR